MDASMDDACMHEDRVPTADKAVVTRLRCAVLAARQRRCRHQGLGLRFAPQTCNRVRPASSTVKKGGGRQPWDLGVDTRLPTERANRKTQVRRQSVQWANVPAPFLSVDNTSSHPPPPGNIHGHAYLNMQTNLLQRLTIMTPSLNRTVSAEFAITICSWSWAGATWTRAGHVATKQGAASSRTCLWRMWAWASNGGRGGGASKISGVHERWSTCSRAAHVASRLLEKSFGGTACKEGTHGATVC